jgi:hypothetical protein
MLPRFLANRVTPVTSRQAAGRRAVPEGVKFMKGAREFHCDFPREKLSAAASSAARHSSASRTAGSMGTGAG